MTAIGFSCYGLFTKTIAFAAFFTMCRDTFSEKSLFHFEPSQVSFVLILSSLLGCLQARHAFIFPRNTTWPKNDALLRRKTCALLRAKTSALLRRKTCAGLRARSRKRSRGRCQSRFRGSKMVPRRLPEETWIHLRRYPALSQGTWGGFGTGGGGALEQSLAGC